ncbi:MAG: hypothetical protein A2Z35_01295 [Actinobacteria bacterium RBG_19FT_COMBO_36_27]|nr:MAG: hypothetical protein A2Z35_01295 [Actinobacteria bacterium RBG_19FT_COMBO_36_27]
MIIKKISIIFPISLIICFLMVIIFSTSCFPSGNNTEGTSGQVTNPPAESGSSSENISEGDFDSLLETEGFLEVFNSFYYPDSDIKIVEQIEGNDNLFYILLETTENSREVEEYYRMKKIQSIWSIAVIYEESSGNIEESFLEEENENIPIYKFTYNSDDKDKVVNVLIKGLEESRTQIIIIYWNLQ